MGERKAGLESASSGGKKKTSKATRGHRESKGLGPRRRANQERRRLTKKIRRWESDPKKYKSKRFKNHEGKPWSTDGLRRQLAFVEPRTKLLPKRPKAKTTSIV